MKTLFRTSVASLLCCLVLPIAQAEPIYDGPLIDCHVHLWDTDRPEGIYWIKKDDPVLFRSFSPKDYESIAGPNNVQGVVIVQAGQSLPDNQWNLDVTAHHKALFRGVVGNLSTVIGTDEFKPLFEKLSKDPRYVGYRLSGRTQETLTDAFYKDLELTAEKGKTVDFLVGGYSLAEVAEIAKRLPKLKIIIDHFGSVHLDGKPLDPDWVKQFKAVAAHPNVYCKVSALFGRVKEQPASQEIDFYRPVMDLAFDSFGEDRLIYGSDWPVTKTSGDYAAVVKLTRAYFDAKGQGVSEKLFYRNAIEFYGVQELDKAAAIGDLKMPRVEVNVEERCVDVAATVCLSKGMLELIACIKDTKEHESILKVNASAMHIHTSLLLLGAKSGNPAMQKKIVTGERERWVDIPPKGGAVDVFLLVPDKNGEMEERPISDFITKTDGEIGDEDSKFPTNTFLFAGSHLENQGDGPRRYLADLSGNVISLSTFGDELLCLPDVHGHINGNLEWRIDTTQIPEVGTDVKLRLRPQVKAKTP